MYFVQIGFLSCNRRLLLILFFLGQCVIGQEDKPITVKPLSLNQPFNDFNRITIATTVSNASHQKILSPAFCRFLESSEGFIYD